MTKDLFPLLQIFQKHALENEQRRLETIKIFKEMYPEDPIPNDMLESFNLPEALATITEHIMNLEEK